ncbi:co-chaperone DjlA [Povalibacter sp.]|uniref:co-chaperone DjlA n=1 Tax=Povalibacter sp. TaxID=1962978 RepID=UPI002F40E484
MMWQGKALGAVVGIFAAGPVGVLFGAFIGHLFDVEAETRLRGSRPRETAIGVQEAFFRASFQVMGHIAKADGRVSEEEIRAARAMMGELRLGEREVRLAIELFRQGKATDFPLEATLQQLHRACRNRPDLCRMFMQIQLQAALWSGGVHPSARRVLTRVANALDVSAYELVQMEALLRMQRSTRQSGEARSAVDRTAQAYEVLGMQPSASDAEVTKAYRRLMNQNHPDKLHAKGLPESMMKVAEEKTRQIRAAYEVLCAARGMK